MSTTHALNLSPSPTLRIEGGLFSPDLLEALLSADLPGQKPQDFGLPLGRNLTDEIASVYHDTRALWQVFQHRLERLPEGAMATSETREMWVIPFLRLLGYDLHYQSRATEVDGIPFPVSHFLFSGSQTPVHIVGWRQELGRLPPSGRPRLSPHALVQEYLNRSEALWGLVTNGRILRLLRDSTFVRRQAYVEFDLDELFDEERFTDFILLYRLLHRTRLPQAGRVEDCLLERYYQQSIEQGGRVREHLREGVEECLTRLANGFLGHPESAALREWVQRQGALALYRQLLRLVYRFLFLLVAEERGLMGQNPLYLQSYGISRLRRLCDNRAAYTDDIDLWLGLRSLWQVFQDEKWAALLEVPPLNGELFAHQELDNALITNRDLLDAFWHLAFYDDPPRRVNYAALDTEELGSVYESLLEMHPSIDWHGSSPCFQLEAHGKERRATGSYYTPPQLVSELIRSALEPVIVEKLRAGERESTRAGEHESHALTLSRSQVLEKALLSIKVCDPACGSGHFLLAAARRLGKELARIRTGEDEPAPEQVRVAIRDVVAHCIYGVDKNQLAAELCRVALWIESHAESSPLAFLDHHIKCGDSLVGVIDVNTLKNGLPDGAFDPLEGDDRQLAASLKKQNKSERKGQLNLFGQDLNLRLGGLAKLGQELDTIPDNTPDQIRHKRSRYEARWSDPNLRCQKQACDLWTAAFFQAFSQASPSPITTAVVRRALAGESGLPQTLAQAAALAAEEGFFHWPLEFPEVFAKGGFDVLLSNPPWERIKLQEQEFFASRDARVANAANAAARKQLIAQLPHENSALWQEYRRALHTAESASRFLRACGAYPLTGRGDINTYSVFAERIRTVLAPQGRVGLILPTGIATDATNQYFFADLVEKRQIASLFDFENRAKLFPAVDSRMKFCLLTLHAPHPVLPSLRGRGVGGECITLSFFATRAEHLRDLRRVFTLTRAEIARINPNTRTLPIFRTRQDAELTKTIYQRVPVLVKEAANENPWGVHFLAMFHMSNDSHLFRTRAELEREGWRLEGNRFVRGEQTCLPLYEAKMIWHYDHRFGTYAGVADRSSTHLPTPDERQHADPHFLVQPWYWVDTAEVRARLGDWRRGWLLGFRRITNSTNERTGIFSLLPKAAVGDNIFLALPSSDSALRISLLLGNFISIAFDWVVRQKLAGVNMNFFYVQQFPVLPPAAYRAAQLRFIVPRVLELTYTAWDLAPFAADVWNEADQSLRAALRAQWEASPRPPASSADWEEAEQAGAPFPPFVWNEERRAVLRAELDAYYARLYGLTRKQLRYILDPADLTARELEDLLDPQEEVHDPLDPQGYAERTAKSDFPSETFRVLKEKELRQYGEYRTRRLVLQAWERIG